jgi:hypothetical protein
MIDHKTKKKRLLSQILKEIEVVLHGAVDVGIEKNLSPYEMLLVSIQTLYDNSNKKKKDLANQKPLARVFHFPTKDVDRVSDEIFDGLNRDDDDDKNGA